MPIESALNALICMWKLTYHCVPIVTHTHISNTTNHRKDKLKDVKFPVICNRLQPRGDREKAFTDWLSRDQLKANGSVLQTVGANDKTAAGNLTHCQNVLKQAFRNDKHTSLY